MGTVAGSIVLAILLLTAAGMSIGNLFVDFVSVYEPFVNNTFSPSDADSSRIGVALFGEYAASYSQEYIVLFMAAGLVAILLANLFNGIGGPFFWLLLYGFIRKYMRIERNVAIPILFFMILNALILFVFLFITRYLSSRYAMLLSLMLALAVPLVIARIIDSLKGKPFEKLGLRVVILFLAYCAFDAYISFGVSKDFVFDSVDWIAEHTEAGNGVVTNNHAIAYFSGKVENYDQILRHLTEGEIIAAKPEDFIALEMHFDMTQLVASDAVRQLLKFETAFPSVDDQQIAIYRRVNP
jgi:hypothetical protein